MVLFRRNNFLILNIIINFKIKFKINFKNIINNTNRVYRHLNTQGPFFSIVNYIYIIPNSLSVILALFSPT